ncbi:MAG: cytosine/creatinine deaminase [Frankiaceae bacterium]|nr:cytosine/creatinine deaminase [Frankiaceae bacterium]
MLIRNARTLQRPDGCDLAIADGVITAVLDSGTGVGTQEPAADAVDVGGKVVLPATVDAHVHLDKAYLMSHADAAGAIDPTLPSAIASVVALRPLVSAQSVADNARRAVDALSRNGTTAARAQVEIDPAIGLDMVALHQQLAAEARSRIHLQLVAFPQRGLGSPAMRAALSDAMRAGADVVGGCPYVDDDPAAHLDLVFALAEKHGTPIDLHLDFTDEPSASLIALVADRTRAHGMAGAVTIGHVTSLAAMPPDEQQRAFDVLAALDIALVALPVTDMFLAGHGEPGQRSIAPVERAVRSGVRVAIGNNNIGNPFAPFGNANLLHAAWLTGIVRRLGSLDERGHLLAAVTTGPASILGLTAHGTAVGERADLVVLDCDDVSTAVLQAPVALATIRGGDIVHTVSSPFRQPVTA